MGTIHGCHLGALCSEIDQEEFQNCFSDLQSADFQFSDSEDLQFSPDDIDTVRSSLEISKLEVENTSPTDKLQPNEVAQMTQHIRQKIANLRQKRQQNSPKAKERAVLGDITNNVKLD